MQAGKLPLLLSLCAGLLMPLAFAPLEWAPLTVLLLSCLFWFWYDSTAAQAWWRGWAFGTGMFVSGVYWVYISMHEFGAVPVFFAALLTLLFALFLGLFVAFAGWLSQRFFRSSGVVQLWLVFPAMWVLMEWVRSWLFTGFPWLNIGVSQVNWPLSAYAPLVGEYGVSWLLALTAAALVSVLKTDSSRRWIGIIVVTVLWVQGQAMSAYTWTESIGKPFKLALVQGDVPQVIKWDPDFRTQIISGYLKQTKPHWDADVIVWPETAISAFYHHVPEIVDALDRLAHEQDADMLVGIPYQDRTTQEYYNSVLSLGKERGFYHKRHLVPFGEFIPFQKQLRGLLDIMGVPMSGFSRGEQTQTALKAGGYLAGLTICYEISFNSEVIQSLPQANYLVNISNNTWFGDSVMPFQQLQMARMRARETERFVVSSTNNGVSAVVNHLGEIIAQSPQFQQHVLTAPIQARSGATPFVRWGNWPVLGMLLLVLLFVRLLPRHS